MTQSTETAARIEYIQDADYLEDENSAFHRTVQVGCNVVVL